MNAIDTNNDKGMSAILQGVGLLIDEKNRQSTFDKTLSGIITKTNYETNTYCVRINGYEYKNINSTIKANVNDSVLIMCPQNQFSQMFIYDKIDTTNYIDEAPIYFQDTTIDITNDIKGILKDTTKLTLHLESGCIYELYGASYVVDTGALGNYSVHIILPSLLDDAVLTTPFKLYGTASPPYTISTFSNQTLTLTNLGANYNAHFALKKIY